MGRKKSRWDTLSKRLMKRTHESVSTLWLARYLGAVDVVGVMLRRRDHEGHAFIQLDARQRRDPHVEEDAKQHSQRDEAEHVCHDHGHS